MKGVMEGEHNRELSSKLFNAHCLGARMGRPAYHPY